MEYVSHNTNNKSSTFLSLPIFSSTFPTVHKHSFPAVHPRAGRVPHLFRKKPRKQGPDRPPLHRHPTTTTTKTQTPHRARPVSPRSSTSSRRESRRRSTSRSSNGSTRSTQTAPDSSTSRSFTDVSAWADTSSASPSPRRSSTPLTLTAAARSVCSPLLPSLFLLPVCAARTTIQTLRVQSSPVQSSPVQTKPHPSEAHPTDKTLTRWPADPMATPRRNQRVCRDAQVPPRDARQLHVL